MTYTPIADADVIAPVDSDDGTWQALITNDAATFEEYAPGFDAYPYGEARTSAREYRFMWLGNMDNAQLTVGVRAVASSGTKTVTIATPGVDSDSVSVTTEALYAVTLDAVGPQQEVIVSCAAPSPQTLTFKNIRAYLAVSAPVAGTAYGSQWRKIGALWYAANSSIPSEIQSRIRTNPTRIAIDRPVCVLAHVTDTIKAVSGTKSDLWDANDTAVWSRVGRTVLPRCDLDERWYRCYVYTNETVSGASYSVRIGANEEAWSGSGWHSWRVRLGRGPHEVWANIKPGVGNGAAIRTLQVWRSEL